MIAVFVAITALPGAATLESPPPDYAPDDFPELFAAAPLPNLTQDPPPPITGDPEIDARIRSIAEERGYRLRPLAGDGLVERKGLPLQPSAADAWDDLRADAAAAGHELVIESAFRDQETQRQVFLSELDSFSDEAIDERLMVSAPPGYSKHQTGYALDLTIPGVSIGDFDQTGAFDWLVADDYANALRHGWVPSYPEGAGPQGPMPEPWEWTFVGPETVRCGLHLLGRAITGRDDLTSCRDWPVGRATLAHVLARTARLPDTESTPPPDATEHGYAEDVAAALDAGLIDACGTDAFCPNTLVEIGTLADVVGATVLHLEGVSDPAPEQARSAGLSLASFPCAVDDQACLSDRATRSILAGMIDDAVARTGVSGDFVDTVGSTHAENAEWAAGEGITAGCNPPIGDAFCPAERVTRGQMSLFLMRALDLTAPEGSAFEDTRGTIFDESAAALAEQGITLGCNEAGTRFCPYDPVTRGQMAAFLTRAYSLSDDGTAPEFSDVDGSIFEAEIAAIAAAGITEGCAPDRYCPSGPVTRGQMATFLFRSERVDAMLRDSQSLRRSLDFGNL